jgi:cell wall-associated NlpC family hydrolase
VDIRVVARTVMATGALAAAPVIGTATSAAAYVDHGDGTVTIERGDTISAVARGTGHDTQAVLDRNGLGWSTTIHVGQVVALPDGAPAAPAAPALAATLAPPPPPPPPPPPAPAPAPAPEVDTSAGAAAVQVARASVGVPYRSGGTSPATGFDCSGLVQHAFAKIGVALPRTSAAMRSAGYEVDEPRVGDLVLFDGLAHVGLYAGDGRMVDSPRSGGAVSVRSIWTDRVTFRRVV